MNTWAAGIFGLIFPGAGQFYTGRWTLALFTFIFTMVLMLFGGLGIIVYLGAAFEAMMYAEDHDSKN